MGGACRATDAVGSRTDYTLDAAGNRLTVSSFATVVTITAGNGIYSPNGQYFFVMQTDGNLVLYGPSGAVWNAQTNGTQASYMTFQSDGNLVVYGPGGAIWSSGSYGNHCSTLKVQNDGKVVIYSMTGAVLWSTS